MNCLLILNGWLWLIEVLQVKFINNIIEQDHRFIKNLTRHMGFVGIKEREVPQAFRKSLYF
jgi:transposase-like protein